jgi:UDPglucose 6-dehydrogenase
VTCVDADRNKIAILNRGGLPIFEPGLGEIVSSNVQAGRLSFSTDLAPSVRRADAIFIAVGTPSRRGDGHADLSFVYGAVSQIATVLPPRALVVIKSTVPVGTADEVERIIAERRPNLNFYVASNPEFLRAGAAVRDFKHPDRIVVGTEHDVVCERMAQIYARLRIGGSPLLFTSRRSAELIKYAANAFLATKIAFINEVAELCEKIGAEAQDVARGIGLDQRIGPRFLDVGPGFGGSCFPKDALALVKMGEDHDAPMRIVETVLGVNEARKRAMARKVAAAFGEPLRGRHVALLGLSFKPNTDDMREAPSIALALGLRDMGAVVRAYDPAGTAHARAILADEVTYCASAYEAAEGADVLAVVTEWDQFRAVNLDRLKKIMRSPVVVDLRNVYRTEDMATRGFHYYRVGASQTAPRKFPVQATWPHIAQRPVLRVNGRSGPRQTSGAEEVKGASLVHSAF